MSPSALPDEGKPPRIAGPHLAIPIVEQLRIELDTAERREIERIAQRLREDEPALAAVDAFGPRVRSGLVAAPALLFEDYSAVSLYGGHGQPYRSLALAGEGDIVAVDTPPIPALEVYYREWLRLGAAHVHPVAADPTGRLALAQRCAADPPFLERLAASARNHGELNLVPYLGTGGTWTLAAAIAARSGVDIHVAAPPPRLARRANDKLWLSRRLREVLGRDSLPLTYATFGPAALAARVKTLAARHERIFVKVPDSAGSIGNVVLDGAAVAGLPLPALRDRLVLDLGSRGWAGAYPLIAGVWDGPVLDSPSVQLWLPHRGEGPPIVEGVFSQTVVGRRGTFVGAVPSALDQNLQMRLAHEAVAMAHLLQALGYFGRCSFDAVLAGEAPGDAAIHWVECNGRWGGVSVPMTLANRLVGDWRRRPPVIFRVNGTETGPVGDLPEALRRLEGKLFRPDTEGRGIVIIAPALVEGGARLHLMALEENVATGRAAAAEAAALLESTQD